MDLEKEDREQKKAEETGSTEVNNAFLTDPSTNKEDSEGQDNERKEAADPKLGVDGTAAVVELDSEENKGEGEMRTITRLTSTPATSHKNSKLVKFDRETTDLSEMTVQRFNNRMSSTREAPKTPERSLAFDPCRLPETPLEHQPRTLYLLATDTPKRAPPIKAWRGYGGNIYFEPVNLKKAPIGSKPSTTISLYNPPVSQELTRRSSLNYKLASYYEQHQSYEYKLPPVVAPVHYDVTMIEDCDGKVGRAGKNWAHDERRWMRGLQSTGSLRLLPSQVTRSARPTGGTRVNFRLANEALGRTAIKKSQRITASASRFSDELHTSSPVVF
ncbi:uncharacterized protein LOC134843740 [Symsagittifera roscoffensis]|uniref:uncharacterized protein LOC134843740 n=1 Tax=Symsagittifera roscoffensis TaxID=84072 RepID=UPI00307C226D